MARSSSIVFLISVLTLAGCGKMQPLETPSVKSLPISVGAISNPAQLNGYAVDRLMILFFREGLSVAKWKSVFGAAQRLSSLQKAKSKALRSKESDEEIGKLDDAINGLLAGELIDAVSYFVMWTSSQFSCQLQGQAAPEFQCSGISPQDVLPHAPKLGAWSNKAVDVQHRIFTPYFSVPGSYDGSYGAFSFELQLRPEPSTVQSDVLLKGDVVLSEGAVVLDEPQGKSIPTFKYGYAEMLLTKTAE